MNRIDSHLWQRALHIVQTTSVSEPVELDMFGLVGLLLIGGFTSFHRRGGRHSN